MVSLISIYVIGQQIRPITRILRQPKRGLGHAPQEKFGFLEAQTSYFQHFEEYSNMKLTF
jgi:hypothetical protein